MFIPSTQKCRQACISDVFPPFPFNERHGEMHALHANAICFSSPAHNFVTIISSSIALVSSLSVSNISRSVLDPAFILLVIFI